MRPLAGLRLDAVLIEGAEAPTVRAQLALRQLASWLGAPLMVGTAGSDVAELTALRDAGAGAILARGDLAATLAAADEVPPPPRVRDSVAPLVPPPSSNGHDHDDEDF